MYRKMSWNKYHAFTLRLDFDDLEEYVRQVHGALKIAHKRHKARVKKEMDRADVGMRDTIANHYLGDDFRLEWKFPALCSSSTFVAIYSFLEHEMTTLCNVLQKRRKYAIGLKDLAGSGYMDQAANYLEKVCGLINLKVSPEWNEIKQLQKIRNVLAHRQGKLQKKYGNDDPDKPIRDYVAKKKKSITIDGTGELVLTKSFCDDALSVFRKYLMDVCDQLPDEPVK